MAKKPKKTDSRAIADNTPHPLTSGTVSSPASTGGAGTLFEQHVDAYWLAHLLVRGIPPILNDCAVVEVYLQTEHLGWHTDDFLIVGQNGSGDHRKLAGQVKRTFTVSATDDECRKVVQDFWMDFKNSQQFSPSTDRFALVTLRGTTTLLEHFSGLLDCARAAADGVGFERRLTTPGFVSTKAVRYCDELRTIIGESEGRSVSTAELWLFLRVLHILSLDLNSATRQTEGLIKTLLAHTTSEQDAIGAAEASWNALLREVGEGMPEARSFRRDDLPWALRQRHSLVGAAEQRALRTLSDHSALILGGIRSTIGSNLHLERGSLVQELIEKLESTQVVLVSGPAGSGKSGIAKDAISILATDHFAFSFRAEELAHSHFDQALQMTGIPANAAMLAAILAGQHRKVLLVESVERLLEKSTRDAFNDLLTLVAADKSWRLVLTCRDYSSDLVRACFLESLRVDHSVVMVPLLDDDELGVVEASHPSLARPLANPALRRILRNPYVLDKALQIHWSDERPLPQSEREFRALFWQEIVRADQWAAGGMPHRREVAFVNIALHRARELTLYTSCGDLDPEAIDGLRRDSLIVSSPHSGILVSPAHDVLEDWAILRWLEEQYVTHEDSIQGLSAAIGTYPALRRTYRKWVAELLERDRGAADALFQAALGDGGLQAHFRDDTLVSLLRSPSSVEFLERHRAELFVNDEQLLRRVIHLLRVACVTTPVWLEMAAARPSLFNVPDGPAWACVLRQVQTDLESFAPEDYSLLLGLIEDWARAVAWQTPYPDGAESAAAIAHWLLPRFKDYQSDDQRKRTLHVIAKIPNADRERFSALLEQIRGNEKRDPEAEDFREIIFGGLEGMPAARDVPEALVAAANNYLLCSEADLRRRRDYTHSLELETLFGIKHGRTHDFFPPSAYRGPFLPLLRHHPRQGLAFVTAVFNHSAEWYAHPRVHSDIEPPFEITLTFADGTSRRQWSNARLWRLYRGTSVGPYVLQSLLMALERWLLEFAEVHPHELDWTLLHILQQSDSAALTAVVASVATAFPHASGETLLVLLRSPRFFRLDRQRLASESQAPSTLSDVMPQFDAQNRIHDEERKRADARPHRRLDLESAIVNLQFGPLAPRVHEILDRHRAEMLPAEKQSEDDRLWRLAMHRMDLRQYTVADYPNEGNARAESQVPSADFRQYVRLDLKAPEPDIKDMVDKHAAQFQNLGARTGLLMWGVKVFGHQEGGVHESDQWRERLQEARVAVDRGWTTEEYDPGRGGPGFVAAVCTRDHWEEMSDDEREWCLDVLCSEVGRDANNWIHFARDQHGGMEGDRPSAWALPLLLGKPLSETSYSRVRQALAVALAHSLNEVRRYAASGVGSHLWGVDRELAMRCVNTLATEATLIQQTVDKEFKRPYPKRRLVDDIEAEAALSVRQRFLEPNGISADAHRTFDPTRWFGAEANRWILAILGQAPNEAVAVGAFQRLATTLAEWWDADDDRRRDRSDEPVRDYQTESVLASFLEEFLLRTTTADAITIIKPIVDAVDRHPDKVHWLLTGLIIIEDRQPNTSQFWALWDLFAAKVRRATWLARIDHEHAMGAAMISAIFLGRWWKEEVRHWRSLEGHAGRVHALFETLPPSSTVLDAYLRFLYHVGQQSLPEAFIHIAKRLQQGDTNQMMREANTIIRLEILLQRYVYGRPLELKCRSDLRNAVLFLLDLLVENGSSAAFRMRDDFVTPVSTT